MIPGADRTLAHSISAPLHTLIISNGRDIPLERAWSVMQHFASTFVGKRLPRNRSEVQTDTVPEQSGMGSNRGHGICSSLRGIMWTPETRSASCGAANKSRSPWPHDLKFPDQVAHKHYSILETVRRPITRANAELWIRSKQKTFHGRLPQHPAGSGDPYAVVTQWAQC